MAPRRKITGKWLDNRLITPSNRTNRIRRKSRSALIPRNTRNRGSVAIMSSQNSRKNSQRFNAPIYRNDNSTTNTIVIDKLITSIKSKWLGSRGPKPNRLGVSPFSNLLSNHNSISVNATEIRTKIPIEISTPGRLKNRRIERRQAVSRWLSSKVNRSGEDTTFR